MEKLGPSVERKHSLEWERVRVERGPAQDVTTSPRPLPIANQARGAQQRSLVPASSAAGRRPAPAAAPARTPPQPGLHANSRAGAPNPKKASAYSEVSGGSLRVRQARVFSYMPNRIENKNPTQICFVKLENLDDNTLKAF